jgi:hypothetical protein
MENMGALVQKLWRMRVACGELRKIQAAIAAGKNYGWGST